MTLNAAVLTISDRVAAGEASDESGPEVARVLTERGMALLEVAVVPDEPPRIQAELERLCLVADVVVTAGGTGLGPKDRTPEATRAIADYEVPGLAEEMRRAGLASTPMALLSRGLAVVRGRTLVLNLPGSPKGAAESLLAVIDTIPHAVQLLRGETEHPA